MLFIRSLSIGGAERQVALLAAGLAARAHEVTIVLFYGNGETEALLTDTKVRLVTLDKTGRWDLGALLRLRKFLIGEQPDILYAFLPTQTTLAALLLPRRSPTRLVFGSRATAMDLTRYDWLSALTYKTEKWLSGRADLIIANADQVRDDAVARGLPAERMAVVYNGIDVERMRPGRESGMRVRRSLGIEETDFVIGIVARLDPMKDHETFLRAAAGHLQDQPDARFVCVGQGAAAYQEHLRDLAKTLGIDSRVIWTGTRTDMTDIYNAFDIATSSSAFGEGFSNSIGEAMACGIPVVATDVGDSGRIVGDSGEIVPIRQPEALAAAWARLRQRMTKEPQVGAFARARIVENFSVNAMVENTESLLLSASDSSFRQASDRQSSIQ
jgi:glycosyltransferase involved in cell wall biosynthesis